VNFLIIAPYKNLLNLLLRMKSMAVLWKKTRANHVVRNNFFY